MRHELSYSGALDTVGLSQRATGQDAKTRGRRSGREGSLHLLEFAGEKQDRAALTV